MTAAASEDSAAAPRTPGPRAACAAFALAATLCLMPTVATMVATWATSSAYHHGFVIPPLVVWLIWRSGTAASGSAAPIPAPPGESRGLDSRKGDWWLFSHAPVAVVALLSLLWLAGRALSANVVEQFAFVSLLIAGAVLAFGAPWARARAFPLALLYFMVPFGTSLAPPLQNLAASVVTALLNVAQIDTARDGLILSTATGRFEIAQGCAGLNFLLASVIIGAVYGALAMRGWKKRLILIAALAALSVAANLLRIFLVVAVTAGSGGRIELAADHLLFGWALYGVLLAGFMIAARHFADEAPIPQPAPVAPFGWKPMALALVIVVATAGAERLTTPALQSRLSSAQDLPPSRESARGGAAPRVRIFPEHAELPAYKSNDETRGDAPPLPPLALLREGGKKGG